MPTWKKTERKKDIKAQFFFHLYLEFLTTVLNLFQTSESVFQDVASVIKYNFQMEAQPDLVNPNQFAKSICIRVLKLQLMNQLCIYSTRPTIGLVWYSYMAKWGMDSKMLLFLLARKRSFCVSRDSVSWGIYKHWLVKSNVVLKRTTLLTVR